MKRPILIAVTGYIIGILVGLYFKISIVPFCILVTATYLVLKKINLINNQCLNKYYQKNNKLKIFSIKRYFRYIKIFINSKVIALLIISSIISNTIVILHNSKYESIYSELSNQENFYLTGTIISNPQEKQYNNKYKIKTEYKNIKIKLYITVSKDINLDYGDKITFIGTYIKPEVQRNYKGFDYSQYLKQLKVYGTMKARNVEVIQKNQVNKMFQITNNLSNKIIENTNKILDKEYSSILLGLVLGDKSEIDETTQANFRNASMSHILAVSGMHVAYIVLGITLLFKNIIGKRKTYFLNIIILMFYMFITNFSPSITRAGIMGILMILSKIIYRKNDIYTSISFSLLLILSYNPFLIQNLGLQLSYMGVIGIVLLNKKIFKILQNIKIKNKKYKYLIRPKIEKYIEKVEKILSIIISVQIAIMPIILYNLNTLNPYFLISNLILSLIIGPIVIVCFLFIIIVLINFQISKFLSVFVKFGIIILKQISKVGELPFAKIYISTPRLFLIIIYYFVIIIIFHIIEIYLAKKPNMTQRRQRNLIAYAKIKVRENKKRLKQIIVVIFISILIINVVPKNLKIHFIDVGQGDSCLIVTPHNKTILIDGGGSSLSSFDVGKNTLIPYILDRGFTKIDVVIISHFDSDHVGRNTFFNGRIES